VTPIGHAFTKEGKPDYVTPRAVEASELPGILEEYSVAAANAKKAGFDGVEIHAANAYFQLDRLEANPGSVILVAIEHRKSATSRTAP
jgi:2,4-dienoyl-CoA reductase-like NADH-dependent reductase (Old Yellow Enzyme family)